MTSINHPVLAGHDLGALRNTYVGLGFTLTPRGQQPMGTDNSVIQLRGNYIELLAVTGPEAIPEHSTDKFSFAARDDGLFDRPRRPDPVVAAGILRGIRGAPTLF
jgi:hypothetical protein